MYRITRLDGTELGVVDSVHYIKIAENGCFIPTDASTAIGLAFDSVPYNLTGHNEIDGETVSVSYVDGSAYVKMTAQNTANLDYLSMMTGIDFPDEEGDVEPTNTNNEEVGE